MTKILMSSSPISEGTPTTARSSTAGWVLATRSTSHAETFSPRRRRLSFLRPLRRAPTSRRRSARPPLLAVVPAHDALRAEADDDPLGRPRAQALPGGAVGGGRGPGF